MVLDYQAKQRGHRTTERNAWDRQKLFLLELVSASRSIREADRMKHEDSHNQTSSPLTIHWTNRQRQGNSGSLERVDGRELGRDVRLSVCRKRSRRRCRRPRNRKKAAASPLFFEVRTCLRQTDTWCMRHKYTRANDTAVWREYPWIVCLQKNYSITQDMKSSN